MTTQQPGDVVERLRLLHARMMDEGRQCWVDAANDAIALIQSQAAELTRLRAQPDTAAMREAGAVMCERQAENWSKRGKLFLPDTPEKMRCLAAYNACIQCAAVIRAALPLPPAAQEEKL